MNTDEIIQKAKAYYKKPGNSVGGRLHIVLDDGNIRDSDIEWCINYAKEQNDVDAVEIGNLLLKASKTERRKIIRADYYS